MSELKQTILVEVDKNDVVTLLDGIAPKINIDVCIVMERNGVMRETGNQWGGPDFRVNRQVLEAQSVERLWELYQKVKPKK